ncbi:hypothetical protein UFOVP4_46 [uncultured Caudovirales phage]|uniref:Uncharacterized protein n=1 Tax=uncultured Caudovirales phage TaxID=2100421 RepID=A0A6J7VSL7_9CAUD|nr:hypothetical protein UFOVP4_46 [uncultured Caudovirales phage]CAB4241249.1 hypothetical protein UFOVP64_14 [uncultured Caudovirales phage]CAB5078987.1 hypothetical protein UFOVP145_28 [uncultured Caudovirales phage]
MKTDWEAANDWIDWVPTDLAEVLRQHRLDAYLEERAKIVAWLRGDWSGYDTAQRAKLFAGLIEAEEHLK